MFSFSMPRAFQPPHFVCASQRTAAALMLAACLASAPVQAAPKDDLDNWLADKGLSIQLDQVRQSVSEAGLRASDIVVHAMGFLGVPYRLGGNSIDTGFDCSGFVKAVFEQTLGLALPRRAEQQAAATDNIEKKDLQPGDLVFFNTLRRTFSHVGIYVGNNRFIHSPRPGAEVRVENMDVSYWSRRFDGARRVSPEASEAVRSALAAGEAGAVQAPSAAAAQPKR